MRVSVIKIGLNRELVGSNLISCLLTAGYSSCIYMRFAMEIFKLALFIKAQDEPS